MSPGKPASSTEEARQQLQALGVPHVDYQQANLFTAHTINRCIFEIHQAGGELVPSVRADAKWFESFGGRPEDYPALFDHHTNTLVVNPASPFWSNEEQAMARIREAFDAGFYSSPDVLHLVRHEYGHFLHFHRQREVYLRLVDAPAWESAEDQEIARKVSRYAGLEPSEFVSETFAGLRAGKEYDDAVMNLYRRYGGPVL